MRIKCEKDILLAAVQIVQKATANKTTLPILTGIYMSAVDGILELQATDYEMGISIMLPVEVIEAGKAVLSGKIFPEIIRKIPGKLIEISSVPNNTMISISAEKSEFKILSFPADEFPVIKKIDSDSSLNIDDDILRDMIRKTVFACSSDESRPLFTGALIEMTETELGMVATNTHRLALKKITMPNKLAPAKMIIPSKLLAEVAKFLNYDHPVNVSILWLKGQVVFAFENIYVISRLIEGQFPDYKKVIPTDFLSSCVVKAEILHEAVERVSLLAKDGEYSIIKISFSAGLLELAGNNPDAGSATESLEVIFEGNPLEIAFNAKYLLDVLRVAGPANIIFHLKSSLSPVMLNICDDNSYTYILTPIRTN